MISARMTALALVAGALTVPAAVIGAVPAHAATTYTWTKGMDVQGADHHSWTDAANWSPQGVPDDGDSVIVPAIAGQGSVPVDNVPDVTLQDLTVAGSDDSHVVLGADGESITVTGHLTWTGGRITAAVALPDGATGSIAPGAAKALWGDLTVAGDLSLAAASLEIDWAHRIDVAPGGTLSTDGASTITTGACCGDPNRLVNRGTVDVTDGTFTVTGAALDQGGTLHVADGASLVADKGLARLRDGGSYTGGGRLAFDHTTSPDPDFDHPDADQGAVLFEGTSTFADGFALEAGPGTTLTGTGSLAGSGTLGLSASTVYADLSLGSGIDTAVTGTDKSRLGVWDAAHAGYHAALASAGTVAVAPGSELDTDPGSTLTLTRGGRLQLPGGATLGARECCSDTPELVAGSGSVLQLGGGNGTAQLHWVNVSNRAATTVEGDVTATEGAFSQHGGTTTVRKGGGLTLQQTRYELAGGTLAGVGAVHGVVVNSGGTVAPGTGDAPARLEVSGYRQGAGGTLGLDATRTGADLLVVDGKARLGGRLVVDGPAGRSGAHLTVLRATRRRGTFARASVGRWQVRYTATSVSLTR